MTILFNNFELLCLYNKNKKIYRAWWIWGSPCIEIMQKILIYTKEVTFAILNVEINVYISTT